MSYAVLTLTLLCATILLCVPAAAYQNPLKLPNEAMGAGIADPGLLRYMGKYYLYATKVTSDPGIRCWESKDLVNWTFKGFCTGDDPVFAQGHGWSPGPFYYNGKFYLYVCGIDQKHKVFESDQPTGPFKCVNSDLIDVNSLDAVPFLDDDGRLYLFYAGWAGVGIQFRTCSSPTKADGPNQTLKSCQFSAEDNDNFWTEGPTLYKRDGTYYLAYCGNDWARDSYQVRAAKGKSISKLTPQKTNPIIAQVKGEWVAPGCNWIITGPDLKSLWNVYHVRKGGAHERRMCLGALHIDPKSGDLICDGPTWQSTPNPAPPTWHEDFARTDLGPTWQSISGKWKSGEGRLTCQAIGDHNTAEILCKSPIGQSFVAEFNLRLVDTPAGSAKRSYGVSICRGDSGSLLVMIDAKSKSLQLRNSNSSKALASAPLPKAFTLDVWHAIVVEKRGSHLTAYFDGMRKIDAEISATGTAFGFITQNCRADFGWCGISNL